MSKSSHSLACQSLHWSKRNNYWVFIHDPMSLTFQKQVIAVSELTAPSSLLQCPGGNLSASDIGGLWGHGIYSREIRVHQKHFLKDFCFLLIDGRSLKFVFEIKIIIRKKSQKSKLDHFMSHILIEISIYWQINNKTKINLHIRIKYYSVSPFDPACRITEQFISSCFCGSKQSSSNLACSQGDI